MIRFIRSLFAWREVGRHNSWVYYQNDITGRRRAQWQGGVYGFVNYDFIRDGDIIDGPFGREIV